MDLKKAATKNQLPEHYPPKILKISFNTSTETFHNLFNKCLITSDFPDNLKLVDVSPVLKEKDPLNKKATDQSVYYLAFPKFLKNLMQK